MRPSSRAWERLRVTWTTPLAALGMALALAACTASAATPPPTSPRPSASASSGKVDVSRESTNPDPHFDYGFTVLITDDGFQPHWLVAECCKAITWKNMTTSPVTVTFDHQLVTSRPIPPGGTFAWRPKNIQSVTYHDKHDPASTGIIQVNQTFES